MRTQNNNHKHDSPENEQLGFGDQHRCSCSSQKNQMNTKHITDHNKSDDNRAKRERKRCTHIPGSLLPLQVPHESDQSQNVKPTESQKRIPVFAHESQHGTRKQEGDD